MNGCPEPLDHIRSQLPSPVCKTRFGSRSLGDQLHVAAASFTVASTSRFWFQKWPTRHLGPPKLGPRCQWWGLWHDGPNSHRPPKKHLNQGIEHTQFGATAGGIGAKSHRASQAFCGRGDDPVGRMVEIELP